MSTPRFLWLGAILFGLNLLIFFLRKHGFDYKDFANRDQLQTPANSFPKSFEFSSKQLIRAQKLLNDSLRLDTLVSERDKLLAIDHFLYRSLCSNHAIGPMKQPFSDPFSLFENLRNEKSWAFQCGEAAYLQAYFCAAAGMKTRLVQHLQKPATDLPPDSHVYNEVWLTEKNQWVVSDFFQNRHLLEKDGRYLSAADLLDACLKSTDTIFTVYRSDTAKLTASTRSIVDPYFSKNYYLAFFRETNPAIVYSWKNKGRHYLLDYSHFQVYDPMGPRSNFKHRIKQVVFFGWLLWLVIFAVKRVNKIA